MASDDSAFIENHNIDHKVIKIHVVTVWCVKKNVLCTVCFLTAYCQLGARCLFAFNVKIQKNEIKI